MFSEPNFIAYLAFWLGGGLIWVAGALYLAGREGLSGRRAFVFYLLMIPVGFVGAAAYSFFLEHQGTLSQALTNPGLFLTNGWRLPGALGLVLLTAFPLAILLRLPLPPLADSAGPFFGLFIAFGRIGCFLDGCCHGRLSERSWAVSYGGGTEVFRNQTARAIISPEAAYSQPVEPLQLYMSLAGLVLFIVLLLIRRWRAFTGEAGLATIALGGWVFAGLELLRESIRVVAVPWRQEFYLVAAAAATAAWVALRIAVHFSPSRKERLDKGTAGTYT